MDINFLFRTWNEFRLTSVAFRLTNYTFFFVMLNLFQHLLRTWNKFRLTSVVFYCYFVMLNLFQHLVCYRLLASSGQHLWRTWNEFRLTKAVSSGWQALCSGWQVVFYCYFVMLNSFQHLICFACSLRSCQHLVCYILEAVSKRFFISPPNQSPSLSYLFRSTPR